MPGAFRLRFRMLRRGPSKRARLPLAALRRETEASAIQRKQSARSAQPETEILADRDGLHTASTDMEKGTSTSPVSSGSKGAGKDYLGVVNKVHAIGRDLSAERIQELYVYLNSRFESQNGLRARS